MGGCASGVGVVQKAGAGEGEQQVGYRRRCAFPSPYHSKERRRALPACRPACLLADQCPLATHRSDVSTPILVSRSLASGVTSTSSSSVLQRWYSSGNVDE